MEEKQKAELEGVVKAEYNMLFDLIKSITEVYAEGLRQGKKLQDKS